MNKYQNALLAGVAALALIAGTGFASAQEQSKDQNTTPKAGQMHTAQPAQNSRMHAQSQSKPGGMSAQNTQGTRPNATGGMQGMQQNANSGKRGAQQSASSNKANHPSVAQKTGPKNNKQNQASNTRERNNGHMARSERMNRGRQATAQRQHGMQNRQTTAQRQRGMRGLQANASGQAQTSRGTNVRLSEQQRTRIRDTIINAHNAPRLGHANFAVNVGTVIPRDEFTSIHVVPVPEYLVRIEPRWRGLEYFIFSDEVVIVNPHNLRIVAIVPV
jgi:Protein of unknown function (DUF1236)